MAFPSAVVSIGVSSTTGGLILDDVDQGILGTNTLGTELFTAITDDVLEKDGISINRGSTRNAGPYFAYEAGSCQFRLKNLDGTYDPENLAGPYVVAGRTQLAPGLPIKVEAVYQGATWPLFNGTVESWQVVYDDNGRNATAVVTASDAIATLAIANPVPSPLQGGYENAGRRIGRVLTGVAWPKAARNIDGTGTEQLQETTLSSAAYDECRGAADNAFGFFAVDVHGRVVYTDKRNMPRNSSVTFNDSGSNLPIGQVETSFDSDQIFNQTKLTRVGGVEQTADDQVSQARFGLRTYENSSLILTTDEQVRDLASFVVAQYGDLSTRIEGVSLTMKPDATNSQWFALLNLDILDRASMSFVTPDGRTIERDGLVRGLNIGVRKTVWSWSVSFYEPLDPNGDFVLGDSEFGVLSQNTLARF
jgi:hypothetical protein